MHKTCGSIVPVRDSKGCRVRQLERVLDRMRANLDQILAIIVDKHHPNRKPYQATIRFALEHFHRSFQPEGFCSGCGYISGSSPTVNSKVFDAFFQPRMVGTSASSETLQHFMDFSTTFKLFPQFFGFKSLFAARRESFPKRFIAPAQVKV